MATGTATKSKLKIFPLADRVAIKPLEETETMKGGLYIPDTAKEKPIQGEIVAVGTRRRGKNQLVPMGAKVGGRVMLREYSGSEAEVGGGRLLCINETHVLAQTSSTRGSA